MLRYMASADSHLAQISREYRRLFGAPPREDIARLQTAEGYVEAA
jgi:hypothetical protein